MVIRSKHVENYVDSLRKGPWCGKEDILLIKYVEKNGPQKWGKIASELKRTSRSCRLRWFNQLSPDINHADFTAEEDEIIIDMVHTIGGKWAKIARALNGRTDNQVKNQWHSRLKKVHRERTPQQLPKRKFSRTAGQKANSNYGKLSGSCSSLPNLVSAPLATNLVGSVAQVPPPTSLHLIPPCPPHGYNNFYLAPGFVAPYPAANQINPPGYLFGDLVYPPTSDVFTSLGLCPPGSETNSIFYPDLFPSPHAFFPTEVHPCGPIGEYTAMMQDAIGSEGEPKWAGGLAGSNQVKYKDAEDNKQM